jgi:hypothetical protein
VTVNPDLGNGFRLGAWTVVPEHGEISNGAETHRLEPKLMDVRDFSRRKA